MQETSERRVEEERGCDLKGAVRTYSSRGKYLLSSDPIVKDEAGAMGARWSLGRSWSGEGEE